MDHRRKWLCVLVFIVSSMNASASEKMLVTVYAYHLKPPYIIDIENEKGLYYDFSRYLTSKSDEYEFHTLYIPRKRIEVYLKKKRLDGVLVGVNPIWFKDKARKKYLWTPPVFEDQDEIVSLVKTPFEYSGPSSLVDKKMAAVLGYYYYGIDELVKAGRISRSNTNSEESVLKMLLSNRTDVGIVSRSAFHYLTIRKGWRDDFHLSLEPHDTFSRHVLVPHNKRSIYDELMPILKGIHDDTEWKVVLKKYR